MPLSGGVIDLEDDFLDIETANLQSGLFLTDFSFQWFPTGRSFYLFAGPGFRPRPFHPRGPAFGEDSAF